MMHTCGGVVLLFVAGCLLLSEPPQLICDSAYQCPGDAGCRDGLCVPAECDFDDCAPGSFCDEKVCLSGCRFDFDCIEDEVCSSFSGPGDCVECVEDFHCGLSAECGSDNTCR